MEESVLDETEDIEPTLDFNEAPTFESRSIKRQDMDDLVARVMSGLVPRTRPLKSWEPAFLDERHLQAVFMRATGLKQSVIANLMGWDQSRTSIILNHPDAQYILTKLISYAADEVLDVQTRIKGYAGEALDKVVDVMRNSQDLRLASANAFEILKMAGHGAVEKKEVKTEIAISADHVSALGDAIREAQQVPARIETISYRSLASDSGRVSSVVPETPVDSGHSTSSPPSSSPQSEAKVA